MILAPLLLVATATSAPSINVDGAVGDALYVKGQIWLTTSDRGGRRLVRVDAAAQPAGGTVSVTRDAIFVDACPDGRVIFADPIGLVAQDGARLMEGHALFTVPDPSALLVADLCGKSGDGKDELRFPVVDGFIVRRKGGAVDKHITLHHEARAYSGRVHRGLRPDRGYAEALSLYGEKLVDADVDGDGDTDLVAIREGNVTVWLRGPGAQNCDAVLDFDCASSSRARGGVLQEAPVLDADIGKKVGAGADADLRIRILDVDGDGKSDAVIGVTRGAVPEKSEAWAVSSSSRGPFSTAQKLWKRDGLVAAIGNRSRSLVVAEVDTSLMSLSAVVVTGRIPVKVALEGKGEPLAMQAKVDVRGGHMDGALPVVSVDFDGDGIPDLLDLGEPGKAALHKGTADGFALDADTVWDVPAFVHVVAMPELPGVVLVGAPRGGSTRVAIVH